MEQGQDDLIDDLDYRGIRNSGSVEKELVTEHRLGNIEAPWCNRAGVDLAPCDGPADDLPHDLLPRAPRVAAQLQGAGLVGKRIAKYAA